MPKSPGRRSCSWSKNADITSNKTDADKSICTMEQKIENKELSQASHLENITSD